ncbi:multiple epidermal growth factor-like domains protein 11 [Ostrea edulis]|uniref:multiple epidermal growth factor-like domains protein 11 n=1 Tax=Ostrea edulis TaxID=37623 RepID=UPI0024AFA9CF|nr:multiple epidermal growth factor-like domains protein 11 [Ostrea edulis]
MLQICLIIFSLQLCTAYENIALRKPTWQLHPYNISNPIFDASNAVDGLKSDLGVWGGQCAISNYTQHIATWRVDLQDILSIRHITIYYRTENAAWGSTNAFTGRFLGFSLYVSNTTDRTRGKLCFHDTSYTTTTIPAVLNVTCPVHGQYVIYYNERLPGVTYPSGYDQYAFNELCEVEVYGCPVPGYFGPDCSFPYPDTNCRYCHIETGACQGCKLGYQGHQCELPCSHQYYGELCKKTCGNCSDGVTCNNVDGTCTNGCEVGVYGDKCKTPCPIGWQGKNCSRTCTNCDRCERFTGQCTSPCYPGWKGTHCTEECDGRKYGVSCIYNCGTCLHNKQCHHINGSCLQGCDAGFEGNLCKTTCSVGYYGGNCPGKCSVNCGVPGRCNKTTGQCEGGCQPGWRGILCDTKCDDNQYGPGCNQTCGKCREGKQCHHISGSCNNECGPGYQGDKCDEVCEFGHFGAGCKEECSVFCQKSRDCHHVTGYCTNGCKTGWHGKDCLEVESQEQETDTRFYTVLGVLCLTLVLNGVYVVYRIVKWNKTKLDEGKKYHPSDSTTFTKDAVLKIQDDGNVNSGYQELTELSQPSTYDSIH